MKIWHTFYVDELPADEVEYEAYIHITSFGTPDNWYEPGDSPEYEIEDIFRGDQKIPVYLPVRLRDKFEAWFNNKPIRKRLNPEWQRLADICDISMESFDWDDAASSYYDD